MWPTSGKVSPSEESGDNKKEVMKSSSLICLQSASYSYKIKKSVSKICIADYDILCIVKFGLYYVSYAV